MRGRMASLRVRTEDIFSPPNIMLQILFSFMFRNEWKASSAWVFVKWEFESEQSWIRARKQKMKYFSIFPPLFRLFVEAFNWKSDFPIKKLFFHPFIYLKRMYSSYRIATKLHSSTEIMRSLFVQLENWIHTRHWVSFQQCIEVFLPHCSIGKSFSFLCIVFLLPLSAIDDCCVLECIEHQAQNGNRKRRKEIFFSSRPIYWILWMKFSRVPWWNVIAKRRQWI
jgi:hypothetical protein